jgi:CheY-like chemotaxis protein
VTHATEDEASLDAPPRGTPRRILFLDDEKAIQAPLVRYFAKLGCLVDAAAEPEEAEALIAHLRYDLSILDLRLGRFGNAEGLEVLREIRRRDRAANIIVLSAYISPEVEEEAKHLGAAAVVRKPQGLADLAQLALVMMESA